VVIPLAGLSARGKPLSGASHGRHLDGMGNLLTESQGSLRGTGTWVLHLKRWADEASPSGSPWRSAMDYLQKLGVGKDFNHPCTPQKGIFKIVGCGH